MFEAIAALALGVIGAAIRTPELREVTWRSEMKRRCVLSLSTRGIIPNSDIRARSAEEQDPRLSFKTFAERAGILSDSTVSAS